MSFDAFSLGEAVSASLENAIDHHSRQANSRPSPAFPTALTATARSSPPASPRSARHPQRRGTPELPDRRHSGPKSGILQLPRSYFDLTVCGANARFMEAYTLNCAALRSAFCLASPSGNCFASLARASARSSRWSAVKNATLFLLRMPDLMSVSTNCHRTNRGVRRATCGMPLAFAGCGRILCSAASNARTPVAKA